MHGLNVTSSAVTSLPNTLEDLSLTNFTPLDAAGTYAIAFSKFVNLKYLHLASTSLGDAAFTGLKLPRLEGLSIWECPKVTKQTTESIMQLPSLRSLWVASEQISPQLLDSLNDRDRKLDVHITNKP